MKTLATPCELLVAALLIVLALVLVAEADDIRSYCLSSPQSPICIKAEADAKARVEMETKRFFPRIDPLVVAACQQRFQQWLFIEYCAYVSPPVAPPEGFAGAGD